MIDLEQNSHCAIVVGPNSVKIDHKDYGQFDVTQTMRFGEDIGVALDEHSPTAIWWSALASEETHRLKTFQEGLFLRYMAHCRYYAKLALRGMGDKETLEAVKDYVVILFSKERSVLAKNVLYAVWYGSLLSEHQTATAVKKLLESWAPTVRAQVQADFEKVMYSWATDHGITYEDVITTELEIVKNVEILKATAEQFKQRGVLLSAAGGVKKAELAALGVTHVNNYQKDMAAHASR